MKIAMNVPEEEVFSVYVQGEEFNAVKDAAISLIDKYTLVSTGAKNNRFKEDSTCLGLRGSSLIEVTVMSDYKLVTVSSTTLSICKYFEKLLSSRFDGCRRVELKDINMTIPE